jgi:hypothetical protein
MISRSGAKCLLSMGQWIGHILISSNPHLTFSQIQLSPQELWIFYGTTIVVDQHRMFLNIYVGLLGINVNDVQVFRTSCLY